jgi:glycogen operon protein
MHYGFRVHGPWDPAQGTGLTRRSCCSTRARTAWTANLKTTRCSTGLRRARPPRQRAVAPKSVVVNDLYDWKTMPRRDAVGQTVIYEAHVKGLTYLHRRSPKRCAAPIRRSGIR